MLAIALAGYDGQVPAGPWRDQTKLNSAYGRYALPLLTASRVQPNHDLVAVFHTGRADVDPAALRASVTSASWRDDGAFELVLADGRVIVAPRLP